MPPPLRTVFVSRAETRRCARVDVAQQTFAVNFEAFMVRAHGDTGAEIRSLAQHALELRRATRALSRFKLRQYTRRVLC